MNVRDAVEADAEAIAAIADGPADVMRNLIHDRTVRVAEAETDDAADEGNDTADDDGEPRETASEEGTTVRGFVSYDARERTVHVTQFGGAADACAELLREPIRFARTENMTVELLVETDDEAMRTAAEEAGFEETGPGPTFRGSPTVRYRIVPG